MRKKMILTGAILGCLAVILGAFGAHGLKNIASPEQVTSFETGVRYQIIHGLLLIILAKFSFLSSKALKSLFWCIVIGVLLFSGSIYALVLNDYTAFDFKTIGFVTPIGGTLLIIGWILFIIYILKTKSDKIH